jgi:hypothetical protein
VTEKPEMANIGILHGSFVYGNPPTPEERLALLHWARELRRMANQLSKAAKA